MKEFKDQRSSLRLYEMDRIQSISQRSRNIVQLGDCKDHLVHRRPKIMKLEGSKIKDHLLQIKPADYEDVMNAYQKDEVTKDTPQTDSKTQDEKSLR